ncbi:MAG: hypothetical protein ACREQW_00430 [Candidatus Binatia bacterium]
MARYGPNSQVAKALGLGQSTNFLFGLEYEYEGVEIAEPDKLHCFIDRRLAPGYIAWVVAGVGLVQVGLARRVRGDRSVATAAMTAFLEKIAPLFDFRSMQPAAVRAGMIPCGGVVRPVAGRRVLLVGDAAGMVSPVTAGGIHTALKHGLAAGHAIADYLPARARTRAAGSSDLIRDFEQSVYYVFSSTGFKAIRCSICCSARSRCAWRLVSSIFIIKAYSILQPKALWLGPKGKSQKGGLRTEQKRVQTEQREDEKHEN